MGSKVAMFIVKSIMVPPSVAIPLSISRGVGMFINKQQATCCVGREVRLFISSSLLCGISREGAPRRLRLRSPPTQPNPFTNTEIILTQT